MKGSLPEFSHLDPAGTPRMVDISDKSVTARSATARARVLFPPAVAERLCADDWQGPKGPILHTAVIAGTQAVKRTWDLIPFCHPLPINGCTFTHTLKDNVLELRCTVKTVHRTGVEMEALTGVSLAALTVVDMCKALSHKIEIRDIVLLEKTGGKRDVRPLMGLVLAGGKSRRMGQDKALLDFHGKPQAQVAADLLTPLVDRVYLSCRTDQYPEAAFPDLERLYDPEEGLGPLGGILAGFTKHPDAAWLVVACDLPLLTADVLIHLVRERDPSRSATAYTSAFDGLPEPLCTIYEPVSLSYIVAARSEGKTCPRKLLIRHAEAVKFLTLPDGNPLDNINAPEDLQRIKALS